MLPSGVVAEHKVAVPGVEQLALTAMNASACWGVVLAGPGQPKEVDVQPVAQPDIRDQPDEAVKAKLVAALRTVRVVLDGIELAVGHIEMKES